MHDPIASPLARSWRTLIEDGPVAGMTDAMLLERFGSRRDDAAEAAFAALVARHGAMVRAVCRRLLADPGDAEDAFQATFFVLARKARVIRRPERLASWLYGTAHRTAKRLRVQSAVRRRHEASAARPETAADPDPARREAVEMVLDEIARLPDRFRAAVVLCELEGATQGAAARSLGCSDRTLRRRLDRATRLLRSRLSRRGLEPSAGMVLLGFARGPISAAAFATTDATARAAVTFALGEAATGMIPASAALLAEGILSTMLPIRVRATAVAAGVLAVAGLGIGLASARSFGPGQEPPLVKNQPAARPAIPEASPAEQYRALVKRHDDASAAFGNAYQKLAPSQATQERISALYQQLGPNLDELAPKFVTLAEQYPNDPAAVDALLWVVERTMSALDRRDSGFGRAVGRAMEILIRDHAGEPRLGPICLNLISYESGNRDMFLKAIAERSPNRVVRGQATLALAQYLGTKAAHVELLQNPDAPGNHAKMRAMIAAIFGTEAASSAVPLLADVPGMLRMEREQIGKQDPAYLKHLLSADPVAIRRESDAVYERVIREFGDVPHTRIDKRPTRETLADVARRVSRPGTSSTQPGMTFRALDESYQAAEKSANTMADKVGPNRLGIGVYKALAPRWADFGRKMWKLAQENPRHPDAYEALLWILAHPIFFDVPEEHAATLGMAVDALIRDHLDAIASDLAAQNVAEAFNMGHPLPAPHVDRLYRALYERGKSREARGQMGILLARVLKAEAELIDSLAARGADSGMRDELPIWPPSYIERLRTTDPAPIRHEAEAILERVKAEHGDIAYLEGMVIQKETLAEVADRELFEVRALVVGRVAPEIEGKDIDDKPMTLSEFRGKVVVLDFGSHSHCGGCRLVYPRFRALTAQYRDRPFVVLGINNNDSRADLKDLRAKGEVTWRCWVDAGPPGEPGPITTRWNVRGYPSFVVLDHEGRIRAKDLHPLDTGAFDRTIADLVKPAEEHTRRP